MRRKPQGQLRSLLGQELTLEFFGVLEKGLAVRVLEEGLAVRALEEGLAVRAQGFTGGLQAPAIY